MSAERPAAKRQEEPLSDEPEWEVGEIGNYYGGLNVKVEDGQAFWGIENYDGIGWEPISSALYRALRDHKGGRS